MADRDAEEEKTSEMADHPAPNKQQHSVLRASTFSSNNSTMNISSDQGACRPGPFAYNPFAIGSLSNKSNSKRFILRPSPLQHQASLLKEPTLPAPQVSKSFKLEPPKLFSPLSGKSFTLNHSQDKGENDEDDNDGVPTVAKTTTNTHDGLNVDSNNDEIKSNGTTDKNLPLSSAVGANNIQINNSTIINVVTSSLSPSPATTTSTSSSSGALSTFSSSSSTTTTTTITAATKFSTLANNNSNSSATPSFVFGSNLAARVMIAPAATSTNTTTTAAAATDGSGGGGNDGLKDADRGIPTMTTTTTTNHNNNDDNNSSNNAPSTTMTATTSSSLSSSPVTPTKTTNISLVESAAKQQQAKDAKPELREVNVLTGEENESNVLQCNAKLYLFDKETQNWQERGRGLLRLNDMTADGEEGINFHSRLVMRAQGSLRVIMNVKLWSGMLVDRASQKSIKISAVDIEEGLKIYLISANPGDTEHLYGAITSRTQRLKSLETMKKVHKPSSPSSSSSSSLSLLPKKRFSDLDTENCAIKKSRLEATGDESNDSAPYPDTEASNEGFTSSSSPAVQSSSSIEP